MNHYTALPPITGQSRSLHRPTGSERGPALLAGRAVEGLGADDEPDDEAVLVTVVEEVVAVNGALSKFSIGLGRDHRPRGPVLGMAHRTAANRGAF